MAERAIVGNFIVDLYGESLFINLTDELQFFNKIYIPDHRLVYVKQHIFTWNLYNFNIDQ